MTLEESLAGGNGIQPIGFHFQRRTKANVLISDDINGAVVEGVGEVICNGDNAAVRTCQVELDISLLPAGIDFAVDHLAVFMDALVSGSLVSTQVGLFRLDFSDREYSPARSRITAKGMDVAYYLLNAKASAPVTVASGANIMAAIASEITSEGLSAAGLPAIAAAMPVSRTWAPKTSRWERIQDLCRALNYYTAWARADGSFASQERLDPSVEPSDVTYTTLQAPRLVVSPYSTHEEGAGAVNRFAALIDEPTRTPAYALRQNNDPTSPVSIAASGNTVSQDYSSGILLDVTTAAAYAAFELQDAASRARRAVLRTALDPRRDVHETYTLNIGAIESEARYRQLSWTLPLSIKGRMTHQLASAAAVAITVGS